MAKADPSPGDWRSLHLWQIQPVRDVLLVLVAILLLWLGYKLSIVTVPILLALVLAYLFEPLVQWLTRRVRWLSRQGVAIGIIVVAGAVIVLPVTLGLGFAVVQGVRVVGSIGNNTNDLIESVRAETPQRQQQLRDARLPPAWHSTSNALYRLRLEVEAYRARQAAEQAAHADPPAPPAGAPPAPAPAPPSDPPAEPPPRPPRPLPSWKIHTYEAVDSAAQWVRNNAQVVAKEVGERAIGGGAVALAAVAGVFISAGMLVFTGFLTAFFFYFFSTGYGQVLAFWESLIPERKRGRAVELLVQMDRVIAGFIRGRLTICFALGVFMTLGYWAIGVPAPLILGPAVGIMFLIPFFHILGVPIAWALMWLEPSSAGWQQQWWWILFAPVGLYMAAQFLDDYVLTPRIQGKATGMDTPAIVFASIAGGALAGIYGLILAIPVAACVKILLKEVFWPRFKAWTQGRAADVLPIGEPSKPR